MEAKKEVVKGLFPEEECSLRRYLRDDFGAKAPASPEVAEPATKDGQGSSDTNNLADANAKKPPMQRPPPIVPSFKARASVSPSFSSVTSMPALDT